MKKRVGLNLQGLIKTEQFLLQYDIRRNEAGYNIGDEVAKIDKRMKHFADKSVMIKTDRDGDFAELYFYNDDFVFEEVVDKNE